MAAQKIKKKGAVLVFVLGLVVLLGSLCLRLMEETIQELRHVSQFYKRDDLRLHAYSLLDITVGVLDEFRTLDEKSLKTGGGWEDPIAWSGLAPLDPQVTWSVAFKRESGKSPLFSTSAKEMQEIFAIMHTGEYGMIDEDDGQPFYDAWMDWQDEDDNDREEGAEDDFYDGLDPPYFTSGKPVQSFDEFRMIKGFYYDPSDPRNSGLFFDEFGNETPAMKDFRDSFSFYHEGKVNIYEASPFLLRYICQDDESLIEEVANTNYYSDSANNIELPNSSIEVTKGTNETFSVEIVVEKGKANFKLHAIFTFNLQTQQTTQQKKLHAYSKQNEKLKYPVKILRLRENENLVD
jgi:hypothetical protein